MSLEKDAEIVYRLERSAAIERMCEVLSAATIGLSDDETLALAERLMVAVERPSDFPALDAAGEEWRASREPELGD